MKETTIQMNGKQFPVRITKRYHDDNNQTRYRGIYQTNALTRIFEFYDTAIISQA